MTHLSPHFTLAELTLSDTAARLGLDNAPPPDVMAALARTAQGLEAVRIRLGGAPIQVLSGYRSPEVNAAVGGQRNSQHMRGEAADIVAPRFGDPMSLAVALRDSGIEYDQLILEFGRWVHVSFAAHPRHHVLAIDRDGARPLLA